MVAAATKRRSGGGGGSETQIRSVSSSALPRSAEFKDCMFSLSLSRTLWLSQVDGVRGFSKDPWPSRVEQGGEAAIGIWGGRGRLRRRGYLLCFCGFLGLMWICGFDVFGVHEIL